MIKLFDYQLEAVKKCKNGCILSGGVGSGKSLTALAYYYITQGGTWRCLETGKYEEMKNPKPLYIITTAHKRDTLEWEGELAHFLLTTHPELSIYCGHVVTVDSWNNIQKYKKVYNSFFIFDEQRVVGSGAWVKAFLDITRKNRWILLSATPGDTWSDYIPVFVANGFYRNRSEFKREHIVERWVNGKYPTIDRYINQGKLIKYRQMILVPMDFKRNTVQDHEDIFVTYDRAAYKDISKLRWNPYTNKPIESVSELCYTWRKLINSDDSRKVALLELYEKHPKMIVFYNYNYELDILRKLCADANIKHSEWNGHLHEPVPTGKHWMYLVQYNSGAEGWNCITTDTIVFYSQNYSYKIMEQSAGRIDRLNTPYEKLYYYHLKSKAGIDIAINRALNDKQKFNESAYVGSYMK